MKRNQFFAFLLILMLLLSCFTSVHAEQTEYVVKYNDAGVSYTGTWTQSTQNCTETISGSKMTSNSAGTATFTLPSGAPAGNYKIYYFLAHTTTTGMRITVNGTDAGFNASCYNFPSGVVNQYIALGGDTTYALKGDGSDKIVLTSASAGYSRATSIKFVYIDNEIRETYKVRYDDPSVQYIGTWTNSPTIYGDEDSAGSKTTTDNNASCFFPLPDSAQEGAYAVYYFLPHITTWFQASISNQNITMTSPEQYGYGTTATTVRQWIRIGGEDAVFNLKPGEGVTLNRIGYTRATTIKFVRMSAPVVPDTNYLTMDFEKESAISGISMQTGSAKIVNDAMQYTHTGTETDYLQFPALKNTPVQGDVVLDFKFKISNIHTSTVFLTRTGNGLFMHSELINQGDSIYLRYYNQSATATQSSSNYSFLRNTWYRFVFTFHTETAKYDIAVYDLDNQYIVENIKGISPKASAVQPGCNITTFEMQNHNAGGSDSTVSGWLMDDLYMYDIEKLSVPSYPKVPDLKKTYARIPVGSANFSQSENWTAASMPDSTGSPKSLYASQAGEYATYTPTNLEPGWYDISFWNIKYEDHQNPIKMQAEVFSDGKRIQNLPLPVNTVSENRGGIWSYIGTFYFNGNNTEYLSLKSTGGNYARVADVKFEYNANYHPDYTDIKDGTVSKVLKQQKFYSPGGTYAIYADGAQNAQLRILLGSTVIAAQKFITENEKTYIGTFHLPENQFIQMMLDGNLEAGSLYFEDVTNKNHAIYKLTDNLMNNEPVNFLSAGSFKVTAELFSAENPTGTAVLIVGIYEKQEDGSSLLTNSSVSESVALQNGKATLETDFKLYDVTENTFVKAYLWDSFTGMHPLAEPRFFYPHENAEPYLLLAKDFQTLGSWTFEHAGEAFGGKVLCGKTDKNSANTEPAVFTIDSVSEGTYKLWVHSKNFAATPGQRYFNVAVNEQEIAKTFGTEAVDGYIWENGGTVTLKNGENQLSVLDTSAYYARADAFILTRDLNYIPPETLDALLNETNRVEFPPMHLTEEDMMEHFIIDKNFSGGNILVDGKKQNTVYIRPDLSDTETNWFYWNFKATSDIDRTVTFSIGGETPYIISASGVAYTYDEQNWQYLTESAYKTQFTFDMKAGETVHFSCTIPYVYSDLENFLNVCRTDYPNVQISSLCSSEQGRDVPLLTIGNENSEKCIVFTSRHHCCEATPSYLLEGLVKYLATEMDKEILNNYCFYIAPMMDVDGVENGDQGKQRIPHDHNRDYEKQIYNSVRALIAFTKDKNVAAFMDYHCPGLQTPKPYFYYDSTRDKETVMQFAACLKDVLAADETPDKIIYDGSIDFDDPHFKACSKGYFYLEKQAALSTTLEFPYTGKIGDEYTPERMRHFGENVGKTYELFMKTYLHS